MSDDAGQLVEIFMTRDELNMLISGVNEALEHLNDTVLLDRVGADESTLRRLQDELRQPQ